MNTIYGRHYGFTEKLSEAVKAWKEAIKLQPDSPDAHTSPRAYLPKTVNSEASGGAHLSCPSSETRDSM